MSIWTDKDGTTHVGIMVEGRRIHRRLPQGSTKGDAKLIEAEMRRAAGKKQVRIPGDVSMLEVLGLYMEHANTLRSPETAKFHAMRALPWCEGKKANEVESISEKMVSDLRKAYKPATINRTIGTLKAALSIAYKKKLIPENYGSVLHRLPENNQRHNYLSVDQVKSLSDCCSEQVRAAVWIALLTGCRRGEILKLQPSDIIGNRIRIQAGNTKTLKERTVPIVPALRPWLAYIPIKINYEGLKTGFTRAREKAGIDVNFHDLRHSCASLLINMDVRLEVVRDILGHSTVKTTERYAHLQVEKQEEALTMLSNLVSV